MICKAISLGMLCLMKMIIFSPPSVDEKIYYDDSMPHIYDDYNDECGFGRVTTLGNDDPTILVYKRKLHKMELRLLHIIHLYHIFLENDGMENCA